ncbi:ATP-binding protein [Streptomyces sp. NPDC001404]|uniref:ATP-binding protein n=1 Tax=Streptomyces sp. NPDC001404 TaxID=3364571 RepID=UPI00368E5FE0
MRAIAPAREFARETLKRWEIEARSRDITLCVSELTTNALRHGVPQGRGFLLHLWLLESHTLRIEVHDSGAGCPRILPPEAMADGGRGLRIVDMLADKWGVGERDPGKVVWCEFAVDYPHNLAMNSSQAGSGKASSGLTRESESRTRTVRSAKATSRQFPPVPEKLLLRHRERES